MCLRFSMCAVVRFAVLSVLPLFEVSCQKFVPRVFIVCADTAAAPLQPTIHNPTLIIC